MKHVFKGIVAVVVVAGLMYWGWANYREFLTQGSRPPEGTVKLNEMEKTGVPDFELRDIQGNSIKLSSFEDKVVILNFWASWCDPCIEEFPSLLNLIDMFKGQIVLLAVSADHTMEDLKAFLKAFKADSKDMIVLWDKEQKVAQLYGTKVLPESYVIGKGGKLIRKVAGVDKWDSELAVGFFKDLLEHQNGEKGVSPEGNSPNKE